MPADQPDAATAPSYRLPHGALQPRPDQPLEPWLCWTELYGLDLPDRANLETLIPIVMRLPGVMAVRIDRVDPYGRIHWQSS